MLLRELALIDDIKFVHPKDMQDGIVPITARDIITNLPYVEGCHLSFDHHASEISRRGDRTYTNHIIDPAAPSAARVVYDYYGGAKTFPRSPPNSWRRLIRPIRRSSPATRSSIRRAGCCSIS